MEVASPLQASGDDGTGIVALGSTQRASPDEADIMARVRLTPEEREARRKERARHSFSDAAYKHYDPRVDGYGSAEDWISAAEALAFGCGVLIKRKLTGVELDCGLLYIDELPGTIAELKSAFRAALFKTHPDHGGSNDAVRAVMAAFARLTKHYKV